MRMPSNGYTVVEALMVVAISGALFASVTTLISGKQAETEFNTGVRDFENKLQDVLNDVATGVYPSADNIICTAPPAGGVSIVSGDKEQGTNDQCTFVGKAIQFSPSGGDEQRGVMRSYTIVGKREFNDSGVIREPKNVSEASPTLADSPDILSDSYSLNSSMIFRDVQIGGTGNVGGFAVLNSFGQTDSTKGSVVSGSSSTSLASLTGLGLNDNDAYSSVQSGVSALAPTSTINERILICIGDPGNGRRAAIAINGRGTEIFYGTDSIDEGCPA